MPTRSETGRIVFIVNAAHHDYSKAKRFGDLVAITRGRVDITHSDRLLVDIHKKLQHADPEDYLLLGGSPVVNVLAMGYLFRKHGYVKVLYWDGLLADYLKRTFTFEPQENQDVADSIEELREG